MSTRFSACLQTLFLGFSGLVIITYLWMGLMVASNNESQKKLKVLPRNFRGSYSTSEEKSCKIPVTPTFPRYFANWNPRKNYRNCSHEPNLFKVSDDGILELNEPFLYDGTCRIHDIVRGSTDSKFAISKSTPLTSNFNITNRECFSVQCGNSTNFDARLPDKPHVKEKIQYWEKNYPQVEDRPYSVLVFGIDTVSRAHARRSIPKSLEMMTRVLNFTNFESYHSVGDATLPNFMAFLLGLQQWKVRQTCAKTWRSPFDPCPFTWKDYGAKKFVTGYLEDGIQSFNWGGQSGFRTAPTDYYIHHFFQVLGIVKKITPREKRRDCLSKEPVPDFMLRYTKKFVQKFQNIPFFHMTWLGFPFHDESNYLSNFDDVLLEFLKFLGTNPQILKRTLLLFFSDHGDRVEFFDSDSSESFIERGSPPLLIRLPDEFVRKNPGIVEVLEKNAEGLVTPFDTHHTLLHFLRLNAPFRNNTSQQTSFSPRLKDRSSLFVPIPENRTCATTNIPLLLCLCNVQYSQNATSRIHLPKEFREMALNASIKELNYKVSQYKWGERCQMWTSAYGKRDNIKARLVGGDETHMEFLVPFVVVEAKARFESRVKVYVAGDGRGGEIPVSAEVVGVVRANSYGAQSTCLPTVTDKDKEMREFCVCKSWNGNKEG